jgi:asparagine synthase (glutamine-hydrolysing)
VCGIAGIVSLTGRPLDAMAIKPMCDAIAHRGPDDAGYAFLHAGRGPSGHGATWWACTDPAFGHLNEQLPVLGCSFARRELAEEPFTVARGHRRLSILDPSPYGHQPMHASDRGLWVVHNGEIYNFRELRADLERRGHVFRTRTDTEVILALWREHGPDCIPMLDGMFAFAVYDRGVNRLWIARDRFGVKPVYVAEHEGVFAFASEPKALFAGGILPARIHPPSLVEYCAFQNVIRRETIWEGVHLLQPGELLEVVPGSEAAPGRIVPPRRVVDPVTSFDARAVGIEEATGEVAGAFHDAVQRQLVSDVPVGSYLSGGMDSGSIVAVAGERLGRLHTFTAGFDLTNVNGIEQGFDERRLAEQLSYLLQTEHYDVVLHAGDMPAAMERLTWHMDDPRVGMCHQNWYVAKLASRFVKVCLAGTGGDELFAGYPWRYRPALTCRDIASHDEMLLNSWYRLLPAGELGNLLHPDLAPHLNAPRESFEAVMARSPAWREDADVVDNLVHRTLAFEFRTFLHGLLVTDDHVSMAHSLETRVPFLDNDLAGLAWRLAPSTKMRMDAIAAQAGEDYIDSAHGKWVLRKAMERFLPAEFVQQKKQGFSPPDANWYRGPSMEYIKSILLDRRTLERPWWNPDHLRTTLEEHFEGRRNHRLLIWSMLSIEWVQRHFADAPAADAARPADPLVVRDLRGGVRT